MKGDEFFEKVASRHGWREYQPGAWEFTKKSLAADKVVPFGEHQALNSFVPPYPSRSFERFFARMLGQPAGRLFSVSIAVTNRCEFGCQHCCNAGRRQDDVPLDTLTHLADELQELDVNLVTLTGGEPLLRDDLAAIAGRFDDRCCVVVNTTGWGLTPDRARRLKDSGVFTVSISLDSDVAAEHDRFRRRRGAFAEALRAITAASEAGLFVYVMTMARRELLSRERLMSLLRLSGRAGAMELRFVEPVPVGRAAGRKHMTISGPDRRRIFAYQREIASRDDLPIFSVSSYHTTPEGFGCTAGRGHLYIDGSGEVCPCNHVPISFGNIRRQPFGNILKRMTRYFPSPRSTCAGRVLARRIPEGPLPTPPAVSAKLCRRYLSRRRALPKYYRVLGGGADAGA